MDSAGRNPQLQGVVVLNPAMKPFVCHECGAGFHCSPFLENHQKYHTGEHQFICTTCHYTFDNPKTLKTHMVVHRNQSCPICYDAFKDAKDLQAHLIEVHQSIPNVVLTPNNAEISAPIDIKQEIREDEGGCSYPDGDSTGEIYQCPDCAVSIRHESVFYNHVKFHRGDFPFMCNVCNNSFKHFMNFNEHKRSNPGEMAPDSRRIFGGNNLKCEYCGVFFRCKPFIDNHVKFHLGIHPFMCNVCYYSFDELKTLIRHKQIHGFEMLYTCGFCPTVFVKESDYDKHQVTHFQGKTDMVSLAVPTESHNDFVGDQTEKSNQTLITQKESYYISNVDSNSIPEEQSSATVVEQPQSGIFLSPTEHCNGESFMTTDGVNMVLIPVQAIVMDPEAGPKHDGNEPNASTASPSNAKAIVTAGKKTPAKKNNASKNLKTPKKATNDINPNNEEFKCVDCKAEFRCQALLDNHMKYHTGEHPFMCPSCHYTFNNMGTLTKHKYIHQEIKPYECQSCHGTFRRQFELDRHTNKCHRAPRKPSPKGAKKISPPPKSSAPPQMTAEFFDALHKIRKGQNQEDNPENRDSRRARDTEITQSSANSPKQTIEPSFTQSFVAETDKSGNKMQNIQNVVLISNLMGNEEDATGGNGVPAGVNYVVMPANAVDQGGWNYASPQTIAEATQAAHQHNLVGQPLPDGVATQQTLFQNGNYSYVNLQPAIKSYQCAECCLEFQNEFDLDNHLLSHAGEFSYMCEICHYSFDSLANLNTHVKLHAEELSRSNCDQNYEQVNFDSRQVTQVVNRQDIHPNIAADQYKKMDILTASLLSSNIVGMVSGEETRIVINHEAPTTIISPQQMQSDSSYREKVQATICANIQHPATSSYSNLSLSNGLLTQTYGVISKCGNDQENGQASVVWHGDAFKQYNANINDSRETNAQHTAFKRESADVQEESENQTDSRVDGSDKSIDDAHSQSSYPKDDHQTNKSDNEASAKASSLDSSHDERMILKHESLEQAYEQVGDKSYVALQPAAPLPAAPLPLKTCRVELERITFENLENRVRWGDEEGEMETLIEDFKTPATNASDDNALPKHVFGGADANLPPKKPPAKKRTTAKQKTPANKKKSKSSKMNS